MGSFRGLVFSLAHLGCVPSCKGQSRHRVTESPRVLQSRFIAQLTREAGRSLVSHGSTGRARAEKTLNYTRTGPGLVLEDSFIFPDFHRRRNDQIICLKRGRVCFPHSFHGHSGPCFWGLLKHSTSWQEHVVDRSFHKSKREEERPGSQNLNRGHVSCPPHLTFVH